MRRPGTMPLLLLVLLLAATDLLLAHGARARSLAQTGTPSGADIVRGALLYDKWYAVLGVLPPAGNMPIWARQSTNSRSGPDTWRCSECHGWDYRGVQGAYRSGSHSTGFPDVKTLAGEMSVDEIVSHLKGSKDPAHNFSVYLDDQALAQLATFLKYGTIDDTQYIDPVSLQVIGGNLSHGRQLYGSICATCHGEDGKKIVFRSEGVDEYLGSVATRDPWRFLHRTRFSTAGTSMPVGYELGWTPADGRDILAFAQTLPTALEAGTQSPAGEGAVPAKQFGGPAFNLWTGILTGLAAFLGTIGGALLFIFILLGIGVLVVAVLRGRR